MIGLIENSYIVGQGEHREFIIRIKDDESIFESADTVLFALSNIDNEIKYSYSQTFSQLTLQDGFYIFYVTLDSATTLALDIARYSFDVTLIKQNGEKYPFTNLQTLSIVKTIGASITEDEPDGDEDE